MVSPESVGMSSERLARIRPAVEKHIGDDKIASEYASFRSFYFEHNADPVREAAFEKRLSPRALGDRPPLQGASP